MTDMNFGRRGPFNAPLPRHWVPCRVHSLERIPRDPERAYRRHLRIQKKWNKRWGFRPDHVGAMMFVLRPDNIVTPEYDVLSAVCWKVGLTGNAGPLHLGDEMIGEVRVSTVFLGVNMNHFDGPPVTFETMTFGGAYDGHQWRYATWEAAEAGHREVVRAVKQARTPRVTTGA